MEHRGKFVAYYRVSTEKQGKSGLGLEAQQAAVTAYLNGGNWKLVGELTEVETGKRNDRPKLAEALALCRKRKATLVIAKLDRLARNVHFISGLMESGVNFVACDSPGDDRFILHIKAAVAEEEAKKISDRTKAALAALKARGKKLGGWRATRKDGSARIAPTVSDADRLKSAQAVKEAADDRAADTMDIIEDIRSAAGAPLSAQAIARELRNRGITTTRGGTWSATQVMRVLRRQAPERPFDGVPVAA